MPQPVDVGIGGNGAALGSVHRAKNNITIKIGKDTVFSNIDGDEARAGHIVIDGHLCNLLVAKHSLIFETEAELDIQISGDAPLVTNLNVHTKGKCTLALKSIAVALNLSIYAKNIDLDTAINTKGYVILYTHNNKTNFTEASAPRTGRVIFRKPSRIDLCVLYAQEFLVAENLFFRHFFCYTKKLVQHSRSSFEIATKERDSYALDEIRKFPTIIAARLAEFNKNRRSLIVADQLSFYGSNVFKSCTVVADSLNVNGMQFFCFSNITAKTSLIKQDNKLFLYDSTVTTDTLTVNGGLSQVGSDIIVNKECVLSVTSDTNLHSSNIITNNLHMYGNIQIGQLTHANSEELVKYTDSSVERINVPSNLIIVRNIDRAYAASQNQLREIFREISVPILDYNKRAIPFPDTNELTLTSVIKALLYAGLAASDQARIIVLLSDLYKTYIENAKITEQKVADLQKTFDTFIQQYTAANNCFAIKSFIEICFAHNKEFSELISILAVCMYTDMHTHLSAKHQGSALSSSNNLTEHTLDIRVTLSQLQAYFAHLKINFSVQTVSDDGDLTVSHSYTDPANKASVQFYASQENGQTIYFLAVDLNQLYNINLINPVPHADRVNTKLERRREEAKKTEKEEAKKKKAESDAPGQDVDSDSEDDADKKQNPDQKPDPAKELRALQEKKKNELIKPQKLLEAIAVFCHYTNNTLLTRFSSEYQEKIRLMMNVLFADEAKSANEPGNVIIHKGANITGDFYGMYADAAIIINGNVNVIKATVYAKSVMVAKEGSLHTQDNLFALVGGVARVYGKLGSDNAASLNIDHIFPTKSGAVYGKKRLSIHAITTVSSLGKLIASNVTGSSFIYLNFGVVSAWNTSVDTFISFPGLILPYRPSRLAKSEYINKLITLGKMSIGIFSLPAATVATLVIKGGSFYMMLEEGKRLYEYFKTRCDSLGDLSLDETCQALIQAKRAVNESVSLYTAIPSPTAAYESLTTNSIPDLPTDLYRTPTEVFTDGAKLFTEAFATENSSYNLWTNPALRSVVDGAVDVSSIFMPHVHVDSAISLGGSFGISGTMSSQSIWQLQPFGAAVCLNQSDQAIYKYTNSPVVSAAYNANTNCLSRYTDKGQTFAINWSVRAPVYELRGYLTTVRRSLQVRSGYIREGAHFLGEDSFDIKAHDFTIAGTANLPNGSMQITGKFKTDSTAAITTHNAVIFAGEQNCNQRLWEASGVLHVQVGHAVSSPESDLNILPGASYSFRAKTADLQGSEHYDSPHIQVDEMSAQEALDWSRSQAKHANKEFRTGGVVATESTEHLDLQYIGPREDGLPVILQTRGTFSLPPNYDRARGKQFTSYAEALHFAQYVYPTYNLPPPRLPRRRWYERLPRVLSEFFGVSSAAMAAGTTPVTAAASATLAVAAYGFDRISAHTQRRENRVLENHALRIADANRIADAAALDNARHADLQDAAMSRHFDTVASITNGRHISAQDSTRGVTSTVAAIEDRYTRARQDLTQRHAQTAYEIRAVHDRQRRQITYSTTSPRVGIGLSTSMGPTGITSALTFSSGIRGQTATGSLTLHNHDFARVPIRGNTQQPQSPLHDQYVPNTPIPPLTTSHTVSESQSSRFAVIEETDGGFIINPTNTRHTEVRSTSQETVTTVSTTREASAPTADYESVTAAQWQRNYGCKLTKANVFRLYLTNRLLPGDRNYVARVIGGAIVQSVTEGEDATFGRVRRTKDAIVGYFQRGLDVYEREAARLGIKPNITHQTYAAPGLASAALVLVPENSDQVITEIAVMLGLHVVGVGVARGTTWMYNRARNIVARPSFSTASVRNINHTKFNSKADPLLHSMGDARINHPEEYVAIINDLENHGVEVIIRNSDTIAFSPNMSGGKDGCRIILPERFSISALRHEYGHFLDHKALGYPNFGKYIDYPSLRVATERRQYLGELRFAKEYNDPLARQTLIENYLSEKKYLVDNFYARQYGNTPTLKLGNHGAE